MYTCVCVCLHVPVCVCDLYMQVDACRRMCASASMYTCTLACMDASKHTLHTVHNIRHTPDFQDHLGGAACLRDLQMR